MKNQLFKLNWSFRAPHLQLWMDLNELLVLRRAAVHRHPPWDRVTPLGDLALSLRDRFLAKGDMADLQEAISSGQAMLELCPPGHPDRVMALYILSITFLDKFHRQKVASDLENAMNFGKEASLLSSPEFFNQSTFSTQLNSYRQESSESLSSPPISENPSFAQIRQAIWDAITEAMATIPSGLLDARSGVICDRSVQLSQFKRSPEYHELLTLAIRDTVKAIQQVQETVSTYFQYVMLSHRWGNDEPSFHDIKGRVIYDMPSTDGIRKLQGFCRAVRQRGYSWAWSDTCCFNSDSTMEVLEAIGFMFCWYWNSTLTIAYLADVSTVASLPDSVWFTRGWTLQELLGPRRILFFTRDWSVCHTFSNHKQDPIVLDSLERATGISRECLIDFSSCTVSARTKLQWAALRRTTRPQDVAHALLGIFGLHLPLMYGDPKEHAIGRLLEEIMSRFGDISILDWAGEGSSYNSCFPRDITSYGVVQESSQDIIVGQPSRLWKFFIFRTARKLRGTLSKLPPPLMDNRRIKLPCIVHPVKTLRRQSSSPNTGSYVYQIVATGLRPLEIPLSNELQDDSRSKLRYFLIRPWDSRQLDPTQADVSAVYSWIRQLSRPFSAILLIELPHGEYRRIASPHPIMAHPVDIPSIAKNTIKILTIV